MMRSTQSIREQDFSADRLKAVAPTHTLSELDQAVECFGWSIGVAMIKVGQDLLLPVLHCRSQRMKSCFQLGRQTLLPCLVVKGSRLATGSSPEVTKVFFQPVCSVKRWEVANPGFQNEDLAFRQIGTPTQENEAIVHQPPALCIAQTGTQLLAHGIQAGIRDLDDVETIDNDRGMRQQISYCQFVGLPHIHTDATNPISDRCWQALQVVLHTRFVPVAQQIQYGVLLDIGQHTARLVQQMHLINAKDSHRGIDGFVLQMRGGLASDGVILKALQLDFMTVQRRAAAMETTKRRSVQLHLDVKGVLVFIDSDDPISWQVQEVHRHVLPALFVTSSVLCNRRISGKRRTWDSTHFPEVERSCRRFKSGSIPRTFPESRYCRMSTRQDAREKMMRTNPLKLPKALAIKGSDLEIHLLDIPSCCPVSKNPRPGSVI